MDFPPSFGLTFTSKLHNKPSPELKALRLPSPFVVVVVGASRNIGAEVRTSLRQTNPIFIFPTMLTAKLPNRRQPRHSQPQVPPA